MFGIGSQQNDMLEEQYRLKYLKYKEKYLKLKQTGGFGKTSSGIHCFLTTETLAKEVNGMLGTYDLDAITEKLHDNAYVVKDGSNEVELVQRTSLKDRTSELANKMKFWDKTKPAPVLLKHIEKISNSEIMNRCDLGSARKIRNNILLKHFEVQKIGATVTDVTGRIDQTREAAKADKRKISNIDFKGLNPLTHMIVINFAAVGNGHKIIGDIKQVPKQLNQTDTEK